MPMNVMIKIFDATDTQAINAEEGRLTGQGYAVTRLSGQDGVEMMVETHSSPTQERHFDRAVALVATA